MYFTCAVVSILALASATISAPLESAHQAKKRFNGGTCSVHLRVSQDFVSMSATVQVKDGKNNPLNQPNTDVSELGAGVTVDASGDGLPQTLHVDVGGGDWPDNIAYFDYGNDHWGSGAAGEKNSRCSVGGWDQKWEATIDMDCTFFC
ncbi:hypothetical protein F5B20DRAFT_590051 [Whalleya microplaca]|nr:hypothetical protein F5B20DRAFT_590051 [Whalleya microplaca]